MIIYQIYPRSFMDTNGDGIGDLQGIVKKIPYIADLGVDTIWISPFFTSPMRDFGYDISDYRGVDPIFGTIEDFDQVVKTAHDHGLKVMIDQVWGHCSDLHPWFQESRKAQPNDKQDWYIWSDPKPDGYYPNNWLSIFGGPAWTWNGARKQYYLHHFLSTQPALNLRHPDVFNAVMEDALFWVKRGVDGFRIDALPHFLADEQLRDNPPIKKGDDNTFTNETNPRRWQDNIYTQSLPELLPWIEQAKAFFTSRGHNPVMLAEIMTKGLELASECVEGDARMETAYTSELINSDWSAKSIQKLMHDVQSHYDDPSKMCWALGNHDVSRLWSRVQKHENPIEFWRVIVAWTLCVEGYVCWYNGDELGLSEADIRFDQIQDPFGKTFWPEFKGRDGCRTPMPWDATQHEAGFTTGPISWLPIPADHAEKSVASQTGQQTSFLETTRFWMQLRRTNNALSKGKMAILDHGGLVSFIRETDDQKIICFFNFDPHQSYDLPQQGKNVLHQSNVQNNIIAPFGIYIAEI